MYGGEEMVIDNMAWFTAFDENFDSSKYLYHYTDINKAFKIIDGDSLKFSKISHTNDTLESKLKINFDSINKDVHKKLVKWIQLFNDNYSSNLQLLCFSMDSDLKNNDVSNLTSLSDYSGRGFAMPRMWAQYASNNTGVCLVYNKQKITNLIERRLRTLLIHKSNVEYENQLFSYIFDKITIDQILDQSNLERTSSGFNIQCHNFLKENMDFTIYNYFRKLDDWKGEKEFRFLAFDEEDLYIKNSNDALVGVIIGEKTDITNERILCMLCYDLCELKKITFTIGGCRLINIHME